MSNPGRIRVARKQTAPEGDAEVDRGDDGIWRYAGTSIPAVGAQDRTLADVLRVRELRVPGSSPEAVVLSLSELVADSRLNWVLQKGTRLRGGDEDLFLVPWPTWEEHAATPVDAWLPERDADGFSRQLALAERDVRFRREALDASTTRRSQLVLLGTKLGMTRRQIAGVLGLSPGRVQQLYEEADNNQAAVVERTIDDARLLLKHAGDELCPSTMEIPPGWTGEKLDDVLAQLIDAGLLETLDEGDTLRLTEAAKLLGEKAPAKRGARSVKQRIPADARSTS